jgi:hypothetical protein
MSTTGTNKTHWLQNPNKNYLGHWDLPSNGDLIVTMKSAQWEEVKNPITGEVKAKRVVRFNEDVKPFICNEINAQSILDSTANKYMEDSIGCEIQLYIGSHYMTTSKQNIDCIRIRSKVVKKTKPKLTPKHKRWEDAKTAVKTGETDLDGLRENWDITQENFDLLCG